MSIDIDVETGVEFFAPGVPAPGGSKKAFLHKTTGKVIVLDDARRNKDWRAVVALAAQEAMAGREPFSGPVELRVAFVLPRPKTHFHQGKRRAGHLRDDAPELHTIAPDTTKLLRSTEDALKGITWRDDSQVAMQSAMKVYGSRPGARIVVIPRNSVLDDGREGCW